MLLDNLLQHVPDLRVQSLHQLFRRLDVLRNAAEYQLFHHKGLKQLDRHLLGQTALINFQLRTDHDNGAAGIVHTLAEQILTETAGLTLKHIGKGFKRPVAGACHGSASSAVVNQRVNRLLQHTLLVADNDIGSAKLQKSFQTIVSVDDSSVQIIQIGGCKPAAVQLHHRTQIRRNDRNHIHNHPLRLVAGLAESLHNLQSLDDAGAFLPGGLF